MLTALENRLPKLRGLSNSWIPGMIISNRSALAGAMTTGLLYTKIPRTFVNGAKTIRPKYLNQYKNGTGEDAPPNGIIVKVCFEYVNGTILQGFFQGNHVGYIQPNGELILDPLTVNLAPGDKIYERVSVSGPLPPVVKATGSATGGILAAATYYYKVTAITPAGESVASTEVSVVVAGATSQINLLIGDTNMVGVQILGYKIYRGTAAGTETLLDTIGPQRNYIDNGSIAQFTTTLNGAHAATKLITGFTTAGLKAGDTVIILGTTYTVAQVLNDTQFYTTANVTAATGSAVTINLVPPINVGYFPGMYMNAVDANEGIRNNIDMADSNNGFSPIGQNTTQGYGANCFYGEPSAILTTYKPPIALIGTSIMNGTGWANYLNTYRGFGNWALQDAFPYVNIAVGGETLAQFASHLFSRSRMNNIRACKYVISDHGTNDLGDTLANMKAYTLTIAQRCIRAGITKYYHCTILPKTPSSNGWQDYAGQTPVVSGAENNRVNYNTWLRAPVSAGAGNSFAYDIGVDYASYIGIIDIAALAETNVNGVLTLNGGYWKVYGNASFASKVGVISGTVTTLTDAGQAWAVNQWAGYMVATTNGGVTQYTQIISNTATTLTLTSAITAPSGTTTYSIYKGPTIDGIHPTDFMHKDISAAIDISKFV